MKENYAEVYILKYSLIDKTYPISLTVNIARIDQWLVDK